MCLVLPKTGRSETEVQPWHWRQQPKKKPVTSGATKASGSPSSTVAASSSALPPNQRTKTYVRSMKREQVEAVFAAEGLGSMPQSIMTARAVIATHFKIEPRCDDDNDDDDHDEPVVVDIKFPKKAKARPKSQPAIESYESDGEKDRALSSRSKNGASETDAAQLSGFLSQLQASMSEIVKRISHLEKKDKNNEHKPRKKNKKENNEQMSRKKGTKRRDRSRGGGSDDDDEVTSSGDEVGSSDEEAARAPRSRKAAKKTGNGNVFHIKIGC